MDLEYTYAAILDRLRRRNGAVSLRRGSIQPGQQCMAVQATVYMGTMYNGEGQH